MKTKTPTMSQHRVNLSHGQLTKLLKTGHVRPVVSRSDGKTVTSSDRRRMNGL